MKWNYFILFAYARRREYVYIIVLYYILLYNSDNIIPLFALMAAPEVSFKFFGFDS